MKRFIKKLTFRTITLLLAVVLAFGGLTFWFTNHGHAATVGQMTLYLHEENSSANETYDTLSLTPPEPAADTATGTSTSTTNVNAAPPTNFCKSTDVSADTQNNIGASAASTGNRCMETFISAPVGQAITMSTADAASITGQFWSSESASQVASAMSAYIYRWTGSGTSVVSTDRLATLTCAEPGTSATSCVPAAAAPANTVTFAAGDRVVVIIAMNVTTLRSGASVHAYFDSSARTAASIQLGYTVLGYSSANKPTISGTLDDDFTTAAATTACSTSGVAYNTKWTCLQGSAASTAGAFNAEDTTGTGAGDSSSWLWLRNQTTATTATVSNFGSTPSNTFLYQPLKPYGDGSVQTIVNTSHSYGVGAGTPASPYSHSGLALWASNTDYLEVQVYANGVTSGTNTVNVALNNSGTLSGVTSLNAATTTGTSNNVWLGFTDTGGSYQARYSTDGVTWTNVGTAVSHDGFSRVGLNAFTALASPVTTYAGAFEWFHSTLAAASYNQTAFAWFTDADAVAPGAALAANNVTASLPSAGAQARLRVLVRITGQAAIDGAGFNLQYVDPGTGSCASPSGGTPASYTNVSGATLIAFGTYASNTDQMNISAATGDPTDGANTVVPEVFNKTNSLVNNHQAALNSSNDGMWDFGLFDNGAPQGHTYCLRLIMNDGVTLLGAYTNYAQVTTWQPGPTMDQVMRGGTWFSSGGVKQDKFWAH